MFKPVHTVMDNQLLIDTLKPLITGRQVECILLDYFFIDGSFYELTEVIVCFGEIHSIKTIYPKTAFHEVIIRERQLLSEIHPELEKMLDDKSKQLLDKGEAIPF